MWFIICQFLFFFLFFFFCRLTTFICFQKKTLFSFAIKISRKRTIESCENLNFKLTKLRNIKRQFKGDWYEQKKGSNIWVSLAITCIPFQQNPLSIISMHNIFQYYLLKQSSNRNPLWLLRDKCIEHTWHPTFCECILEKT